jgi:hypothetical protein
MLCDGAMPRRCPEMGNVKRMFVEGEFTEREGVRNAARRLMAKLDEHAAKHGMVVTGDVAIAASEPSIFAVPRTMRLEADVVTR